MVRESYDENECVEYDRNIILKKRIIPIIFNNTDFLLKKKIIFDEELFTRNVILIQYIFAEYMACGQYLIFKIWG